MGVSFTLLHKAYLTSMRFRTSFSWPFAFYLWMYGTSLVQFNAQGINVYSGYTFIY